MTRENNLFLQSYLTLIEERLFSYNPINAQNSIQKSVVEAMNYSLSAGGKRIRPVLALEFCRLCGGDIHHALDAACALEMIHTFSLIHDDLPCMDDDDMRRGKPSCHKQFGEAIALLAGDALENLAFQVLAESKENSAEINIRLIGELSGSVGINGMIGGQVIDIENEGRVMTREILDKMYACKTGALIRSACRMGCIAAGADEEILQKSSLYAEKLGLAFQIIDDILDVTGTTEELGKPVGSDRQQGKITFVDLYGLECSKEIAEVLTNEALEILNIFSDNGFIVQLTKSLLVRKN